MVRYSPINTIHISPKPLLNQHQTMTYSILDLKIILCNVLTQDMFEDISNETKFCSNIEHARRCIQETCQSIEDERSSHEGSHEPARPIIICCKQEDLEHLVDLIYNEYVHAVFVLRSNSIGIIRMFDKRTVTDSVKKDLLIRVLFEAIELIRDEAEVKEMEDCNAFYDARMEISDKLIDLIMRTKLNNQE